MSSTMRLLASFVALMMAMGIGRFALTPQLPHLISEGQISLTAAGLVAAANYLGYLLGALDAMFAHRPAQVRRRLLAGLWLCVLLTLASFWAHGFWPHMALRLGTGIASAWVVVTLTGMTQHLAAQSRQPRLGALVFAGPGMGILLTGMLALGANLQGLGSAPLWLIYAAVALLMLLVIQPALPHPQPVPAHKATAQGATPGIGRLGLIYALYGVGYIIPATFMSQMASARFHGQWLADLFWPAFGLAAAMGVVLVSLRRPHHGSTARWLMATLWLQAAGVLACLLGSGAGLALGVLLCGTPFLACMQLVMQRSRELAPHATHRNAGLLTTCFALGQLSGPLLAALSNQFSASLQPALVVAASGLIIAGALLLRPATGRAGAADACVPTARH
ncbi:membrane protein [Pseudomonas putida]|uniref:MFS transporter n=1 Tax=Pseudomonas palmensis TaxID=2815362 RepID=UPI0005C1AC87|nr:membrane protein [Pseudomonas putida]